MIGRLDLVRPSSFAAALGLIGLGHCWRAAASCFGAPELISESIMFLATSIWAVLLLAYLAKWAWARPDAVAEIRHPVTCCFVGLVPASTMLTAAGIAPHSMALAAALFVPGAVGQLGLTIYLGRRLRGDDRDRNNWNAAVYLPAILGSFVMAAAAHAAGAVDLGRLCFGVGVVSWIVLESLVLRRLIEMAAMPDSLRATAAIYCALPFVGCVADLSITPGTPDIAAQGMFGYGIFQALFLLLLRLVGWVSAPTSSASSWTLTLPVIAAALSALDLVEHGVTGPVEWVAMALFVLVNIITGEIALGTAWLFVRGGYAARGLPELVPSTDDRAAVNPNRSRKYAVRFDRAKLKSRTVPRINPLAGRGLFRGAAPIMALASLFTLIDLFGPHAIAPVLATAFQASPAQMGIALNTATIGMAIAGLLTATFGDRIVRKPVMVGALFLLSIPTALLAAAPDLTVFGLLRMAQGMLMCAAFTTTIAYVAEEWGPSGIAPVAMAGYIGGNMAGNLFGQVLTGVVEQYAGWRLGFLALALVNLMGGLIMWRLLPSSKNFVPARDRGSRARGLWLHLQNPRLLGANVIGFLILFTFVGVFTFVNFRLERAPFHLSSAARGLVDLVFGVALVTTPFAGLAVRRFGHLTALVIGSGICYAGVLFTRSDSLPLIVTGLALVCVGSPFSQTVATDFVGGTARQSKAAASGIYLTAYFSGGICGAMLLGDIYDSWGWPDFVNLIAVAYVAMAGTAIIAWRPPGMLRTDAPHSNKQRFAEKHATDLKTLGHIQIPTEPAAGPR